MHYGLQLGGSPVTPGADEDESMREFQKFVYKTIVGGLEKAMNCVENARQSRVEGKTTYYPYVFHRFSRRSYVDAIRRLKEEFPGSNPWVC